MKLRDWMDQEGWTIATLAEKLGLFPGTVYRYTAGSRLPRVSIMQKIAKVSKGKVQPADFYESGK